MKGLRNVGCVGSPRLTDVHLSYGSLVGLKPRSNIAAMNHQRIPAIIISPYQHVAGILDRTTVSHVISILGESDRLAWPTVGTLKVLRLKFDDIIYSSQRFIAPNRDQIADLIEFARDWNGVGSILIHCRAGRSRSPAAAVIAAASLGRPDTQALVLRVGAAKAYFRPNETMLKLADTLLTPSPNLVDLTRSVSVPTRTDPWGPVTIPLPPLVTP